MAEMSLSALGGQVNGAPQDEGQLAALARAAGLDRFAANAPAWWYGGQPRGPDAQGNLPQVSLTSDPVSMSLQNLASIPQRAIEGAGQDFANRGQPGYESQAAGPAFEAAMAMAGRAPFSEAGSVGVGGGRAPIVGKFGPLVIAEDTGPSAAVGRPRNQFTGAFRREGESPLPGNPYRSVNTQAQPVAANSAAAVNRMQAPAAADPALMQQNLARMDNPMSQQMQPPPAANPADVAQWRQVLMNSFGMK